MTNDDALYLKVVNLVIDTQRVSVSAIQRHAQIGFSHAMGYVEEMQAMGIVSAPDAAGLRAVLVQDEQRYTTEDIQRIEARAEEIAQTLGIEKVGSGSVVEGEASGRNGAGAQRNDLTPDSTTTSTLPPPTEE